MKRGPRSSTRGSSTRTNSGHLLAGRRSLTTTGDLESNQAYLSKAIDAAELRSGTVPLKALVERRMDTHDRIADELKGFLRHAYPEIAVRVESWAEDSSRIAIYFIEQKFSLLYRWQRYHYLRHLIPKDFFDANLKDTVWFELAPGEDPSDLESPDEALIKDITPSVMKCVNASGLLEALDDAFCPRLPFKSRTRCHGDFRTTKALLPKHRFTPGEFSDVLHVFMLQGGYCDCEILYNVYERSRLRSEYWKARADGHTPRDPHGDP
jgi:hypothetical protein